MHTLLNMTIRPERAKTTVYPNIAHASIARGQIAAADRARLHALGPRTGGDGPAAGRPLRLLPRPPRPSTSALSMRTRQRDE